MLLKSISSTVKIVHTIASNKAFKTIVFVQTTWKMKEGLVLFWCRVKVKTRAFTLKRCNQRDIIGFWWRNGPRFKLFCCLCLCVFVLVIQCNGLCIKDDIIVETDDPTHQSAKQRPATISGLLLVLATFFSLHNYAFYLEAITAISFWAQFDALYPQKKSFSKIWHFIIYRLGGFKHLQNDLVYS